MIYYKNELMDKKTGEIVETQVGYTKDLEKAKERFAKQNLTKGIYAVINIEEITKEEFQALNKHNSAKRKGEKQ